MKKNAKKKIYLLVILLVVIAAVWFFLKKNNAATTPQIAYGNVTRGNIETLISSTGTLVAIGTVDVGTQVSGKLNEVLVDFNDKVKKNQVLAVIDTTLLAQSVKEAKATMQKMQALYDQAAFEFDRMSNLYQQS